jgi:hypothetical protein
MARAVDEDLLSSQTARRWSARRAGDWLSVA